MLALNDFGEKDLEIRLKIDYGQKRNFGLASIDLKKDFGP